MMIDEFFDIFIVNCNDVSYLIIATYPHFILSFSSSGQIYNILALNQVWLTTLTDIIAAEHQRLTENDQSSPIPSSSSSWSLDALMFVKQEMTNPHGKWEGLMVLVNNVMRTITNLTMLNRM